ncbi:MAG: hypothetical protein DSZ27_09265 [Thiomicrospira sp.]|nr:MAG: hypothetical protein DSZ27_09265 [Thiomicrospira sp.]
MRILGKQICWKELFRLLNRMQ